jgi:phage-related protein
MEEKALVWLYSEGVKSPPFSAKGRQKAGFLLRSLQQGETPGMPDSKPMPQIAPRCHELRIRDGNQIWRIIYRIDEDAIVVIEIFKKKTRATPKPVVETCRSRLAQYGKSFE